MKKRKNIIIIVLILVVICAILIPLIVKKLGGSSGEIIGNANTAEEQRTLWNDFLVANPYLSQMESISEIYILETDLIKLAITSDSVETESIVAEEIDKNPLLTLGDGYKKSKDNINEYLKNLLGYEDLAYNFVDTYAESGNYLLIGENYVFFTKIEIPEKIYIAIDYKEENGEYEVQIYEYDVTDQNRESLTSMLSSGEINEEITISSKYILTGQIENGNIMISTKTTL